MDELIRKHLDKLLEDQAGMVARRQLTRIGLDWDRVQSQIDGGRWVARTPRVISSVTGTLDRDQLRWLAVLHAGPRSMLANLSAAEVLGLTGWGRDQISVLVDDELSFEPVDGVVFFRSRRAFDDLRSPRPGIAVCRLEPALLLWAGYAAPNRAAHGVITAAVQQRLTTPERMIEWVDRLRPLRRAKPFKTTLSEAATGVHSGVEASLGDMCRRFEMPLPARQTPREDRAGKQRWTDAEWVLPDATTLVLEVDGGFHTEVLQAADDARRARRLTTRTRVVLRCTSFELRHEADQVALDLIALGVPGRVPDTTA